MTTSHSLPSLDSTSIVSLLPPPRRPDSHKGDFGIVTVIGGDNGMLGAALLAGRAALHLGAGAVHVGLLAADAHSVDVVQPELMLHSAHAALQRVAAHPAASRPIALGCGLGLSTPARSLLEDTLRLDCPLVLDADALNLLAAEETLRSLLLARYASTLLTPHPGEAARLLGYSTAEVQADRPAAAQRLHQRYRCALVLKGADSLIVTSQGQLIRNTTGNPGMSAPGMGDVLAGMIAALIAQGAKPDDALQLAVYLHGAAGDELAAQGIRIGMTASELILAARQLYNQLGR